MAQQKRETQDTMNVLSTNRRKIGALALIAAGIVAVAIPFLLHSPLNANTGTTTNGNGSGSNTNTNSNTNPTSPSGSNTNTGSSGNSGDNGSGSQTGSSGNGNCKGNDSDNDDTGDPGHGHGRGHAYAYGHDKDKDPLHAMLNRLSRLGSDSPAFYHRNATRTDNGLELQNNQGNPHATSNHGEACRDDENESD